MNREKCPECGGETEFVQFGGAELDVVKTNPEDVGNGLLELRSCLECHAGLEFILGPTTVKVIKHE